MEFGRAIAQSILENELTSLRYCGFLSDAQYQETTKYVRHLVYTHWDSASTSPPKQRPRDESNEGSMPQLQILGSHQGRPFWPETLLTRFAADSQEHESVMARKAKFDAMFPPQVAATTGRPAPAGGGRAGGQCDFSVDEEPLDCARQIDLPHVKDADFNEQRQCFFLIVLGFDCSVMFSSN